MGHNIFQRDKDKDKNKYKNKYILEIKYIETKMSEKTNDRLDIAEFINGPSSLTLHYNPDTNIGIYVFGEHHGREDSCPMDGVPINLYLSYLFQHTLVPIDWFLERSLSLLDFVKEDKMITVDEDTSDLIFLKTSC